MNPYAPLTGEELKTRLHNLFDGTKPVVVDTGDGIFTVRNVVEDTNEVIFYLGEMP